MTKIDPTLNCYIFVIGASDSNINLKKSFFYLRKLFKYNSLEDKTFSKQNQNMESRSFEVQIPDFKLQNLDQNAIDFVIENKEKLIEKKTRFISYDPIADIWFVRKEALYDNSL